MSGRWHSLIGWLGWLTVAAIWGLVAYVVLAHPTPVVSRTWPDGACVTVEPAPFTCEALPDRYEVRWVAPEAGR